MIIRIYDLKALHKWVDIYITGSRVYNPVKVLLTLSTDSLSGRNLENVKICWKSI